MSTLPVDVLYSILEHMEHDKATLASLCRVNRVFREAAESVLYRRIEMGLPAVAKVCSSLTSERLAHHVRHFETYKKRGWMPRSNMELLQMRTALEMMTGLRTLRIHFGGPLAWILEDCTFVELRSMVCNMSCDHHLAQFLGRQTKLTDITFGSVHTPHFPCMIDNSCLPNLQHISADPVWLSLLVPNRPVASIDVWDLAGSGTEKPDWLAASTAPVTTLSVPDNFLRLQQSSYMASLVPQLRRLEIKCITYNLFSNWVDQETQEADRRVDFNNLLVRTLAAFDFLLEFEVRFRSLVPDDETLEQFVMDATQTADNLPCFVMSFEQAYTADITRIIWRRVFHDWKREM